MASSTPIMSDFKGLLEGRQRSPRRGSSGPVRGAGRAGRLVSAHPLLTFGPTCLRGRSLGVPEAVALRGQGGPGGSHGGAVPGERRKTGTWEEGPSTTGPVVSIGWGCVRPEGWRGERGR